MPLKILKQMTIAVVEQNILVQPISDNECHRCEQHTIITPHPLESFPSSTQPSSKVVLVDGTIRQTTRPTVVLR
jgi:hypothetical protein